MRSARSKREIRQDVIGRRPVRGLRGDRVFPLPKKAAPEKSNPGEVIGLVESAEGNGAAKRRPREKQDPETSRRGENRGDFSHASRLASTHRARNARRIPVDKCRRPVLIGGFAVC